MNFTSDFTNDFTSDEINTLTKVKESSALGHIMLEKTELKFLFVVMTSPTMLTLKLSLQMAKKNVWQ